MKTIFILIYLIPLTGLAQLPGYVPVTELEAWFSFDGNLNDDSGNGVILTNYNCMLTNDRFGAPASAFDFSHAQDSRFEGAFNAPMDTAYTFSAWIRRNSLLTGPGIHNKQWVFAHGIDLTNQSSSIGVRENTNILSIGNWDIDPPTAYGVDTTWAHIVVVATPTQRHLYVNCQLDTTLNISYPTISSANFEIGSQIGALFESWDGQIDDVGVWSRGLDSFEVVALCNASSLLNVDESHQRRKSKSDELTSLYSLHLSLFPNPVTNEFHLKRSDHHQDVTVQIRLINPLGQIVLSTTLKNASGTFDVSEFPAGMYQLVCWDAWGRRAVMGLVVE